ncbi:YlmC/YmxH family sporulation protein [Clostridium beijerinckii]|uniref:PRC-barrel domain protein n=1 Tax=Clostridium beijerinckii TaxID=1520 RepID=A0A1S8T1J9_CLOBE|nr:YlmC/YmxH family sporulation protein [Clostridium beijerinckii]MBA8936738.1 YlmC/YmxH family sporulation protein [Clostridium beijerinckii]NMF04975.1 YlmC/YmxH family sporulation protein [Clostridium beijerinckii]NOW02709.1 YlmC/YmxH family sporulation protein [Clostridium beijerinckii]NRT33502.1 YlmC/YmxH family sporulation protein [Clostridium beijerinckii]NRT47071.1 YlmC/YmxH family sporulation protein [Clostridium beijerinckii]
MELELHSLNAMRSMEVIDVLTGTKIGFIKDFKIDCDENKIVALILPGEIKSWFAKEDEKEILWSDIVKIGTDVILVKAKDKDKVNANNV